MAVGRLIEHRTTFIQDTDFAGYPAHWSSRIPDIRPDTGWGYPANFLLLIKEIFEEKKCIQTKLEVSCF